MFFKPEDFETLFIATQPGRNMQELLANRANQVLEEHGVRVTATNQQMWSTETWANNAATHQALLVCIEPIGSSVSLSPEEALKFLEENSKTLNKLAEYGLIHMRPIEELPRSASEGCEHEPKIIQVPAGMGTVPMHTDSANCKHCGVALKAKWEVVE